MVNIIIYLDRKHDAQALVNNLLKEELIANASIDRDNVSYRRENGTFVKNINTVITAQTKALLFSYIEKLVREQCGEDIPIYSLPITQVNGSFDAFIRTNTKKI